MQDKYETTSSIDIAIEVIKLNEKPIELYELLNQVAALKSQENNLDFINQLYMDITTSAKFVFCGDDLWDLKENNLAQWDKDSFSYMTAAAEEEDDEEEILDFSEFILDVEEDEEVLGVEEDEDEEVDEEEKQAKEEEKEYIEVELSAVSTDDDDVDFEEEYSEDDYNTIMDNYEDMYDEE